MGTNRIEHIYSDNRSLPGLLELPSDDLFCGVTLVVKTSEG